MSTTSPRAARRLLDQLALIEPFVVLHDEAAVSRADQLSDVDVLTAEQPQSLVRRLALAVQGEWRLAQTWWYDADAVTTFWTTTDLGEGVQLDLCAGTGHGKYGVLSEGFLRNRQKGVRYDVASPTHEALYLLQKRLVKRDLHGIRRQLDALRACRDVEEVLAESFDQHVQAGLRRAIWLDALGRAKGPRPSRFYIELRRYAKRLRTPNGSIVDCVPTVGRDAAERLSRFLVRVKMHEAASPRGGRLFDRLVGTRRGLVVLRVLQPERQSARGARTLSDVGAALEKHAHEVLARTCPTPAQRR